MSKDISALAPLGLVHKQRHGRQMRIAASRRPILLVDGRPRVLALHCTRSLGGQAMMMRYDPDSDILMLLLSEEPPMDAVEEPGVIVSYGRDQRPVSVEFLEASAHLVTGGRIRLQIEQPDS